jgi:hypothetical protein
MIRNKLPVGTVGYLWKADMRTSTLQNMMVGAATGYFNINRAFATNGSGFVAGAPLGALYADSSKNVALTTTGADMQVNSPVIVKPFVPNATATGTMLNQRFYFGLTTTAGTALTVCASACSATVSTFTTQLTGRNTSTGFTDLLFIALGSTPFTASFTGSITGTTLTTSGASGYPIQAGMQITTGANANTWIVSGSGTTWTVNFSQTVASTTMNAVVPIQPGQSITVSGSVNPGLSSTVTGYVTDIPATNTLVLYLDSALCTIAVGDTTPRNPPVTGTAIDCGYNSPSRTPVTDNGITLTLNPTADVYAIGDKVSQ